MKTHRQTSFLRYTEEGLVEKEDSIVVESLVDLWLEDMHLASFVCTPGSERDLCLGYLITSGIISDATETEQLLAGPANLPNFPPDKELRDQLQEIEISSISANPYQARTVWNQQELAELADSIAANGIIQPIIVRPA